MWRQRFAAKLSGRTLPKFVTDELHKYLDCGILAIHTTPRPRSRWLEPEDRTMTDGRPDERASQGTNDHAGPKKDHARTFFCLAEEGAAHHGQHEARKQPDGHAREGRAQTSGHRDLPG